MLKSTNVARPVGPQPIAKPRASGVCWHETVRLCVFEERGEVKLAFAQAAPPNNSDALGYDRVLVVEFDAPVRAEDVIWSMQEGFDTAG